MCSSGGTRHPTRRQERHRARPRRLPRRDDVARARPRSRPASWRCRSARAARRELDDRSAPLAGLVAVFVFAAQMLNFPVGAGTSGHLIGGDPGRGARRSGDRDPLPDRRPRGPGLLFADGGVTALGTNVLLMGVVARVGRLRRVPRVPRPAAAPASRRSRSPPGSARSSASPPRPWPSSALYAVGGAAPIPLGSSPPRWAAGTSVIGLGEAAITLLAVVEHRRGPPRPRARCAGPPPGARAADPGGRRMSTSTAPRTPAAPARPAAVRRPGPSSPPGWR